jgi:hypothetical protein
MSVAAKIVVLSLMALTALGTSEALATAQTEIVGVASVIDGDTIEIHGQRIRLHAQGNEVVGTFGGTVGQDDGQRFYGTTTTTNAGGVYFGYREAILYNQNCRPSLFDALTIRSPNTAKTFFGTGSQNSASLTPGISADGYMTIGANPYVIRGSGMAPFSLSILCMSGLTFQPGFPIPGAAPGSNAYLLTVDLSQPSEATVLDLSAPPIAIGALEDGRFFITHDEAFGLISLLDPATGKLSEISGFAVAGLLPEETLLPRRADD